MKVQEIMKRSPSFCGPRNHLAMAGRIMAEVGCGVLPVLGEGQALVGVITDRDLALAAATRDRRPSEITVREVMSGEVHTCKAGDDIREALSTMREHRVRRLPVLEGDGRLVGLLSLDDIVLEAQAIETTGFKGPFYADIAQTLKAINVARTPAVMT